MRNGSVLDIGFVITVIFVAAIVLLLAFTLMSTLTTSFEDSDVIDTDNEAVSSGLGGGLRALVALDSMLPLVFVSLGLFTIALAFMLPSNPVFAVFSFITLCVIAFISTVYSNIFVATGSVDALSVGADSAVFTAFVMEHMLVWLLVFGVLTVVAMYVSRGELR